MEDKVAIIDLGTNTFHLLVASKEDGRYRITHRERLPVKIGMGGINDGLITNAGISRAIAGMAEFKKKIDVSGIKNVFAFGTSALRNARNGGEVIHKIRVETGIEVKLITGNEEAEYIYKGVRSAVSLGTDKAMIIDIGGGSVEFIIGNETEIFWKQSIEIGAQRLLERFQKHDPILPSEIMELEITLEAELIAVFEALRAHHPTTLVGSSGTFDTLSDIYSLRQGLSPSILPETPLTFAGFFEIHEELIHKNRKQRLRIPGMIEMRVDMIVVACCLIRFLLERYSFHQIRVSTYSLKEGVLASFSKISS